MNAPGAIRPSAEHEYGARGLSPPSPDIRSSLPPAALAALRLDGAQAIVMTGTGMPTLAAIATAARRLDLPVISSNVCLAWALAATTSATEADDGGRPRELGRQASWIARHGGPAA